MTEGAEGVGANTYVPDMFLIDVRARHAADDGSET
jgi:hypothetical protein